MVEQPMRIASPAALGKAERVTDAAGRYIEFCKSTFPVGGSLRGLKVVVDCAHGATYHVAPSVFEELGAEVHAIGVEPDGLNINAESGATAPDALRKRVLEQGADVGVALDGDGDRLIMVDERGEILDGDELLFIIAEHRLERGCMKGGVVGTLMTNLGLEEALRERGVALKRARVGDRYVLEQMQASGWTLGGETSGHIICLDRMTTGDGIVAALQVLAAARERNRPLGALKEGMRKYPQVMVNVRIPGQADVTELPEVQRVVREVEGELGSGGRVVLRPSGTEPLVRVMVEGREEPAVTEQAERIAAAVQAALGEQAA